jgi:hypothetical protein
MKKSLFFVILVFGLLLAGYSSAGQHKVYLPIINNPWIQDCCIAGPVEMIGDFGLTGSFKIRLDYSIFPAGGNKFAKGQAFPNGPWKEYSVNDQGELIFDWTQGEYFEFSYGVRIGGVEHWIEPACSRFRYPLDAQLDQQHFRMILGAKRTCHKNINDKLVIGVETVQPGKYKIFLNYLDLPIANYQKLFVKGQEFPNGPWVEYAVADQFPCFSFVLNWPHDGGPFHFSYGLIKSDGTEQWIDPTQSKYLCGDHLCLDPEKF